jgi:hypothetical protein
MPCHGTSFDHVEARGGEAIANTTNEVYGRYLRYLTWLR